MDHAAKIQRADDEQANTHEQHEINGEMWRLYVDIPSNSQVLPSYCKVATKLDEVLLEHIEGKR
eukprot:14888239-Ditylum_brightwellii.AAC.1